MKNASAGLIVLILAFHSCTKNDQPESTPSPVNDLVKRIVEIDKNQDSAVATFNYTVDGLVENYVLKSYLGGVLDGYNIIDCFYNPDNSLRSVTERTWDFGAGTEDRYDYVCLHKPGTSLIEGIKKCDSALNYIHYDRFNYDGTGRLRSIYYALDSLVYTRAVPQQYCIVDSITYDNNNRIAARFHYQFDDPSGNMLTTKIENYDAAIKFAPQGISSFVIFDYAHALLSPNNETAEHYESTHGLDLTVTTDIAYDDKQRPVHMTFHYSDPSATTGPGLFTNTHERYIYY